LHNKQKPKHLKCTFLFLQPKTWVFKPLFQPWLSQKHRAHNNSSENVDVCWRRNG